MRILLLSILLVTAASTLAAQDAVDETKPRNVKKEIKELTRIGRKAM